MPLTIHVNAYCSALDELAIIPYCTNSKERKEALEMAVNCLCEIPPKQRPKVCRLAIANLIIGNIETALHFIETALSKAQNL